jgi:hypothetical protein
VEGAEVHTVVFYVQGTGANPLDRFYGIDDFENSDLRRNACEADAPSNPTLRFQKTRLTKSLDDFGQIRTRNSCG